MGPFVIDIPLPPEIVRWRMRHPTPTLRQPVASGGLRRFTARIPIRAASLPQ